MIGFVKEKFPKKSYGGKTLGGANLPPGQLGLICLVKHICYLELNIVKVIEDLSVEITCLCRLLIYTDNDFYLILGFN